MVKKLNIGVLVIALLTTLFIGCTGTPTEGTVPSTTESLAEMAQSNDETSESAPDETSIENAIAWAESLVGESTFPYADGGGDCKSSFMCEPFVASAYGSITVYGSAHILWTFSDQHTGDLNAPRGSLVFFDRNEENKNLGHVALSLGDGNLIEAGNIMIKKNTISDESGTYLGWAWPPTMWPGRSDDTADES